MYARAENERVHQTVHKREEKSRVNRQKSFNVTRAQKQRLEKSPNPPMNRPLHLLGYRLLKDDTAYNKYTDSCSV